MRQYCRSSLGRFPYQHAHCFSHASSLAPPLLDHSAFTSQLDEVDRLLRAFIVQRQRVRQSIPADEESDERMMDSDEESNRRWSSSTDSTAVILAPSDVLPLKTPSISETQVIPGLPRASATIQFDDKAHSFVSAFLDSNPPHTHTEFAPKNSLLYHELQPVGHVIRPGSELNVTHDHLPRPGPDSNSSSPLDGTGEPWNRLTTSGNNEGSFLAPDLETSLGPPGLVPIQEGIFAFSMDYKEGYHDAASRAGKTLMYNQRCGMKRASLPDGTLGDALVTGFKHVSKMTSQADGCSSGKEGQACAEHQSQKDLRGVVLEEEE